MLQQLQQQQPLEQKETQEQTQQVTQQNQSQEQKAECTNVMPASGEKQQVDGAVLNANGPVTGCDTSPSESSAPPGEPASVFTESHPASTAGIAKPDPTNQTQPSVGDDPVSTVQSTSPGDNKETQSAPTNGEGTVQNGNVLSEQSVELDASTAPVKSPAKGWLNPFSWVQIRLFLSASFGVKILLFCKFFFYQKMGIFKFEGTNTDTSDNHWS